MIVKIDCAGAKETKAREYLIRFVFGGSITAAAGLIGKAWGPVVAGLFLAFPAIFPASPALVERDERERKAPKRSTRVAQSPRHEIMPWAQQGSLALLTLAIARWRFLAKFRRRLSSWANRFLWASVAGLAWFLVKRWLDGLLRGDRPL